MKKATKLKAFMLSLIMTALLLPMTSFAQQTSDDFFRVGDEFNGTRNVAVWTITNNGIGQGEAPVGSGLLILGAIGAGYAIAKRKRNKKGAALLLALALTLGFTQCKKKVVEPIANNGNTVHITLTMAGGGSRVIVDPTNGGANNYASVSFESGDKIYVGNGGKYVGYVTYNGTNTWEGDLTSPTTDDYLHLYFLGNKAPLSDVTPGTTTEFSVSIADQASKYPVISYNHTLEKYNGAGSYTATTLYNKCSIMKFIVATGTNYANDPIRMTGMHNKVTVNFATPNASENGFSYSVNTTDGGLIKMPAKDASNITWAIVLPQEALAAADDAVYTSGYKGNRPAIAAIARNTYYDAGINLTITTEDNTKIKDLSTVTADWTAEDGWTLTKTLDVEYYPVKISIADGATVTLRDATINGVNNWDYEWAGITCLGNATIILSGTNTVKGFQRNNPGIQAAYNDTGVGDEYTLTIQGTGSLTASSNGEAAGIGGGPYTECGNITINGGTITATGGDDAAGIGSGSGRRCGNITISSGTVTATGGSNAAGIGTGGMGGICGNISISGGTIAATGGSKGAGIGTGKGISCGSITITSGVTSLTATKGANAINSIGVGYQGTCGTVTIGGTVYWDGSAYQNGGDTYLPTSPLVYPTPAPSAPTGAIDGLFSVSSTKQVYFSQGNLQYQASTGTWRFAEHQYDFIGGGNFLSESNTDWIDLYRWGTSGIEYTGHATLYRPWDFAYYSVYFNPYGSLTTNLYDGEGENTGKADWGYNAISNGGNTQNSGWRTLKNNTTDNEWQYIFNSRTTANEINSTSNARYTQARINIDDWAVRGIILFPDGSIGDTPSGVTWGTINAAASSWTTGTTQCTTAGWAALEAAGCVFLPAAGKYDDSGVSQAEIEGYYWSSSYASDDNAYGMYFYSNEVNPQYSDARHYGLSVRLVKDAN